MSDNLMIHIVPEKVQSSFSALYSVPETHVLFVGPAECSRHNCRMHYRLGKISWLCPSDTEIALGKTEKMVLQAVEHLISSRKEPLSGIILYTGCQTEFLNVDFDYLQKAIRKQFHIAAAHHAISRFQRFDRFRLQREDLVTDLFHLLETSDQEEKETVSGKTERTAPGIQILSRSVPMKEENDFRRLAETAGLKWIRNTGEWESFEDFTKCREAVLNIVTAQERLVSAKYLESAFGVPWILLPDSSRIQVVDHNHRVLDQTLSGIPGLSGTAEQSADLRAEALEKIEETLQLAGNRTMTLDLTMISQPWDLTRALIEYGFQIGKVLLRSFPMPPGMERIRERSEDMEWVLEQVPELEVEEIRPDFRGPMRAGECIVGIPDYLLKKEEKIRTEEAFENRRGSERSADRRRREPPFGKGPQGKRGPGPAGPAGDPAESSRWGYSSIHYLMQQIQKSLI